MATKAHPYLTITVQQYIQGHKRPLLTVSHVDTVQHVLRLLKDNHILSVPVKHDNKVVGLIDVTDLNAFCLKCLDAEDSKHNDYISLVSRKFFEQHVGHIINYSNMNPVINIKFKDKLLDVIKILSTGIKRVCVVDDQHNVIDIITQSAVIQYIQQGLKNDLNGKFTKTVEQSGLLQGNKGVYSVGFKDPVVYAFQLMIEKRISSLAILDERGILTGTLSLSDLKNLAYERDLSDLTLNVIQFLNKSRLSVVDDCFPSIDCQPHTPLSVVLSRLVATHVHRLFAIDKNMVPIAVVSLTDLLLVVATAPDML